MPADLTEAQRRVLERFCNRPKRVAVSDLGYGLFRKGLVRGYLGRDGHIRGAITPAGRAALAAEGSDG